MKGMNLAAKISVLLALFVLFLLIQCVTGMDFKRSNETQLYIDHGQCYFYSTDQNIMYQTDQKITLCLDGEIYNSVIITEKIATGIVLNKEQVIQYQLNPNTFQDKRGEYPCTIYTEYGTFLELMIDR